MGLKASCDCDCDVISFIDINDSTSKGTLINKRTLNKQRVGEIYVSQIWFLGIRWVNESTVDVFMRI